MPDPSLRKLHPFLLVLIGGLFASSLIQYLPIQLDFILNQTVTYFQLDQAELENVGALRYVKDLYFLFFALTWPLLVFKSKKHSIISLSLSFIVFELSIFALGLFGHILTSNNSLQFIAFAGLRWMLVFHSSIGLFCLGSAYHEELWGETQRINSVNLFVEVLLYLSFVVVVLQQSFVYPRFGFSLGYRFLSVFPHAAAFGYAMAGCMIYILLIKSMSPVHKAINLFLIFYCSVASGSRSSIISSIAVIALIYFVDSVSGSISGRKFVSRVTSPFVSLVVLIVVFFVAGLVSGRGSILEDQINEGGRIANSINFFDSIFRGDALSLLFGRGLGYGTNSAYILFRDVVASATERTWIGFWDNTFITLIQQIGFVGLFYFLGVSMFCFLRINSKVNNDFPVFSSKLNFSIMLLLIGAFTQNIFENYIYLPLAFLSLSSNADWFFKKDKALLLE